MASDLSGEYAGRFDEWNDYEFRHVPAHLINNAELWDELAELLCDLGFIEAKCARRMTYELVEDYAAALAAFPEAQEERLRAHERDGRITRYTQELIAYARAWNKARERHATDPGHNPLPPPEDIPFPEIPPSVRPWTEAEIRADTERIVRHPTRLDRVRAFAQFVNAEAHHFLKYASQPLFCAQQGYNSANAGPVAEAAKHALDSAPKVVTILRTASSCPPFNPHPACLRVIEGYGPVCLSADGRLAVSRGDDVALCVWNVETGRCLRTLEGHLAPVLAVSLSADGRLAISGGQDHMLLVWDVEAGHCLHALAGHSGPVTYLSLSAAGDRAVSGAKGETCIWDTAMGRCLHHLEGDAVNRPVTLSADGRCAVSGSWGAYSAVHIWDVETGRCLSTIRYANPPFCLSADGHQAISAGANMTLEVWDMKAGQRLRTLEGHTHPARDARTSANGRYAISGGYDRTLRVWDIETGRCLRVLQGHAGAVTSMGLSADGRRAVSSSDDGTLRIWNVEAGKCAPAPGHTGAVTSVSVSAGGRRAISGGGGDELVNRDFALRVWDFETGQCVRTLEEHTSAVQAVELSADGRLAVSSSSAVSGTWVQTLCIWNVETGHCLRNLPRPPSAFALSLVPSPEQETIFSIGLSPDGRYVVSGGSDKMLRVWDLETSKPLCSLRGHRDTVLAGCLSPDGRRAVSGSGDNTLRVWDIPTRRCLHILRGHSEQINGVGFSVDGRCIISGGSDNVIRIWDVDTGRCLHVLEGHTAPVWAVCLDSDGCHAISGSEDRTVRVWDVETSQCLAIAAQSAGLQSLAVKRKWVVAGDKAGNVLFFKIHGLGLEPCIVTPARFWQFSERGGKGQWDNKITAPCGWCGQHFAVEVEYQGPTFLGGMLGKKRTIRVTHEGAICPHCHGSLKFTPFVVDNREGL